METLQLALVVSRSPRRHERFNMLSTLKQDEDIYVYMIYVCVLLRSVSEWDLAILIHFVGIRLEEYIQNAQ